MTGEVTLRGRVLAIGGLKEKTMAALRNGIGTVLIPKDNVRDLEEIDQTVRGGAAVRAGGDGGPGIRRRPDGNGDRSVREETAEPVAAFCPDRGKNRSHPAAVKEARWH